MLSICPYLNSKMQCCVPNRVRTVDVHFSSTFGEEGIDQIRSQVPVLLFELPAGQAVYRCITKYVELVGVSTFLFNGIGKVLR